MHYRSKVVVCNKIYMEKNIATLNFDTDYLEKETYSVQKRFIRDNVCIDDSKEGYNFHKHCRKENVCTDE